MTLLLVLAMVVWEAVALTLAGKADIPVPDARLETVADKRVLLLRRFDRVAARRIPFLNEQWFQVIGVAGPSSRSRPTSRGCRRRIATTCSTVPLHAAIFRLEDGQSRMRDEIDGIYPIKQGIGERKPRSAVGGIETPDGPLDATPNTSPSRIKSFCSGALSAERRGFAFVLDRPSARRHGLGTGWRCRRGAGVGERSGFSATQRIADRFLIGTIKSR